MQIWTAEAQHEQIDTLIVAKDFWTSEYGRVAGERCYPLETMLARYLASEHGAVVWSSRDFDLLRVSVIHCWPEKW